MRRQIATLALVVMVVAAAWPVQGAATLTPEQRKELSAIRKEVSRVASIIRKKEFDEAERILDEAEERLAKLAQEAGIDPKDRLLASLSRLIESRRSSLRAARPVSFVREIAPILETRCLSCHGAQNPRGRLRLDTFAGLLQGGQSRRPLVVAGSPPRSLLLLRIVAPEKQRMPKDGQALSREEVQTIAAWIAQGARFDGSSRTATLAQLREEAAKTETPATPNGKQTVSFVKDIAPFFVNICQRCHGGNNPRGGLSLVSFESLMKGGESGRVVVAGNPEGSRLYRLVGGLESPRMPQGQARLTRKNVDDLKTWIAEGAVFDGPAANIPLARLVPSEEEKRAQELSKMSPKEFAEFRKKRTDEQWDRVLPNERPQFVEGPRFLVYGNVSGERLQQVHEWAEEHLKALRTVFKTRDEMPWKGRLTIFVFKDRFGYTEFNQVLHDREIPREMHGHSVVSPNHEDAYVALEDIGDEVRPDTPNLRISLADHLTGAFLRRSGARMPEWLVRGTGLALAARELSEGNEYFKALRTSARSLVRDVVDPQDLLKDGTFSPEGTAAVGFALVEFMMKGPAGRRFPAFVARLQRGDNVATALKTVYRTDPKTFAAAFAAGL